VTGADCDDPQRRGVEGCACAHQCRDRQGDRSAEAARDGYLECVDSSQCFALDRAPSMRQVDRDVLPLGVALEHAFERELAADAAFFVTAVGVTWALAEA